ncbi:hypothetical protein Fmac_026604 [Flemingia macrophylla]|uniref:Uncharacterized protein n=1 Tax=Flemingia macrophylla TaxID=520843 RepID=A0ABD1LFA8_9FABA
MKPVVAPQPAPRPRHLFSLQLCLSLLPGMYSTSIGPCLDIFLHFSLMHSCSMEVKVCWVRVAEVDEEEVDVVGVGVYFKEPGLSVDVCSQSLLVNKMSCMEYFVGDGIQFPVLILHYKASFLVLGIAYDVAASALIGASNVFVLGTVLYVLSFSLGVGHVPALLLPEIFASKIKEKAIYLSLGMHWRAIDAMI